jgi:methyl-accepting chemotaxis protein
VITAVLAFQARIGSKLMKEAEKAKNEAVDSKESIVRMLGKIKQSVDETVRFGDDLKTDMKDTRAISGEIANAFNEISKSVEVQTNNITDIVSSMKSNEEITKSLLETAVAMEDVSNSANESTKCGIDEAGNLKKKMNQVDLVMSNTMNLINQLNVHSVKIEEILSIINGIAEQTNLLALNASIEAARAGEQGKGFAVVANEIKKLAEHSGESVEDIGDVLREIQGQTTEAAGATKQMTAMIQDSINSSDSVGSAFDSINAVSQNVFEQARKLNQLIGTFEKVSQKVMEDMESISSITEENSASVEEVMASVNQQNEKIQNVTSRFDELQTSISSLETLYK